MPPLQIELTASKFLQFAFIVIYSIAVFIILFAVLSWWIKPILIIAVTVIGIRTIRHHAIINNATAIKTLFLHSNGTWQLINNKHELINAKLYKECFLSETFIILNFRQEVEQVLEKNNLIRIKKIFLRKDYLSVLIYKDACNKEVMRHLRARLINLKM